MTVAGVRGRQAKWKLLEIPATRFSTSASFRPKLGLCILSSVILTCLALIVWPLFFEKGSTMAEQTSVAAVAKANSDFLHGLYPRLVEANGKDDNLVMSPFSVSTVLAMAMAGAKSATKDQMAKALAMDKLEDAHIWQGYAHILSQLQSTDDFTLEAANKLYVEQKFSLLTSFLDTTQKYFHAEAENVDFVNAYESVRSVINAYVEEKTYAKIKDLIPNGVLNSLTRLVLINAVYFKGNWAAQFDAKLTKKMPFKVDKDRQVEVDMMKKSAEYRATILKELDAHVVEMPYKGDRLSMLFFLSKKPEGFEAMEKNLHKVDFTQLQLGPKVKHDVLLPKFKLESSHDLDKTLKALGMNDMFNMDEADFSGMSGEKDLYVSKVLQKAFIEVNEEGSEAAAATGMIMMTRALVRNPQFICDRPFLFSIVDNETKMVLFSGRVMDPSKN